MDGVVTCFLVTTVANLCVGIVCCVGAVLLDLDEAQLDVIVASAAFNLLAVFWPLVVLFNKWGVNAGEPAIWKNFVHNIVKHNINPHRWTEFTASVPLVIFACLTVIGIDDYFFTASQMVIGVAIVVTTYGQEREKLIEYTERNSRVTWLPIATTIGLFVSQWGLIFWKAGNGRYTRAKWWVWAPTIVLFVGASVFLFILGISSRNSSFRFTKLFKHSIGNVHTELAQHITSSVARIIVTLAAVPFILEGT